MADLQGIVAELRVHRAEPESGGAADTTPSFGLTERELEVATLVARGLPTRAIAGELVITEGTAKVHVARILGKLRLHSRSQLAVWVVQNRVTAPARDSNPQAVAADQLPDQYCPRSDRRRSSSGTGTPH